MLSRTRESNFEEPIVNAENRTLEADALKPQMSLFQERWQIFKRNRMAHASYLFLVGFLLLAVFRHFDNLHYQHAHGTIESEQWKGYVHILDDYLSLPGVVAWWGLNSSAFSVGFQKYVTGRLSRSSA